MLAAVGIARCSVSNKSIIHGYTSLITQWGVVENMIKGYKGQQKQWVRKSLFTCQWQMHLFSEIFPRFSGQKRSCSVVGMSIICFYGFSNPTDTPASLQIGVNPWTVPYPGVQHDFVDIKQFLQWINSATLQKSGMLSPVRALLGELCRAFASSPAAALTDNSH